MHPPLFRPHPDCQEIIAKLVACHEENKVYKFFGVCNDVKASLDACFKAEKERKRRKNFVESQRREAAINKALGIEEK